MNAMLILIVSCFILTSQGCTPEVKQICAKTEHPPMCESTVGSNSTGLAKMVLEIHINAGISLTRQAIEKAKHEMGATSGDLLHFTYYKVCLENYNSVIGDWKRLRSDLKARKGNDLETHLTVIKNFVYACEVLFTAGTEPTPSPLTEINGNIEGLAANCLGIKRIIFPK